MRSRLALVLMLLGGSSAVATSRPEAPGASPGGTWLSEEGEIRVRFERCGEDPCGTIVWSKEPGLDDNNPDPALRTRNIVGVPLVHHIRRTGERKWSVSLYNPEDGKTYPGTITLKGAAQLEVSGCGLGGLICRSTTWSKVE